MQGIDRLGWAAGLSVRSFGLRFGVRVNRKELLPQVAAMLPPGFQTLEAESVPWLYSFYAAPPPKSRRVRSFNLLYVNARRLARTLELEQALNALESDLRLFVAERAKRRVFVHAGVVGHRGRALLVPGPSHSGKTSLVRALLAAGAEYYSDEFAVLDHRGRVHPFPAPLAVRDDEGIQRRTTPAQLGAVVGKRPLPVGLVVSTQYRPGAAWRPRLQSPGKGVLELLANTVSARVRPDAALATLQNVVENAPVIKGARGEADEVAGKLLTRLADVWQGL